MGAYSISKEGAGLRFLSLKIGYRTLKTAVGTAVSILLAQQFDLMFPASAGIITILCIQVTVKQSFRTVGNRILASLLGLGIGMALFALLGYSPLAIMLAILIFLPLAVRFKIQEGFISSMVVMMHLYSSQRMDLSLILNELALLLIGVGVALIVNLYMPSLDNELKAMQSQIEQNFMKILKEFAYYLRHGESNWDGHEMIETPGLLGKAVQLASRSVDNRLGKREDDPYYQYFVMREKQFELLERMMPIVSTLDIQVPQGHQMADFLERLSDSVHPGNTAYRFLDQLRVMRYEIRETGLPTSREEFETRASLFYLLREIERYLFIKHELGKNTDEAAHKNVAAAK
ncbi:aromatic acid exporter family protein [Brevibacillus centrosporus]|uniref:aromatic acid exporter family protein n=1 Tax=Brevibacillus centrosporus TaxID=54910 RepID=UPI002E1DEC54|nr:aromatic acid exporter family protein [Brevibacillus centrosporus]